MELSLYRREGDGLVEGLTTFKYLGRPLDQTYNDWSIIRQNIKRARKVCGRLGKLLRQEGADTRGVEMLYRMVAQSVLLFS